MAGKLRSTWPAVSQGLETAASGGPSPFQSGQTLLAYDLRPEDLAEYPTGFNVAEVGGQIECQSLDLKSAFESSGIQDVALRKVDVPVGAAVRVSGRMTGGPAGSVRRNLRHPAGWPHLRAVLRDPVGAP